MPKDTKIPATITEPIGESKTEPIGETVGEPKYPEAPCPIYYEDKIVGEASSVKHIGTEAGRPLFQITGTITDKEFAKRFGAKHFVTADGSKLVIKT